MHFRTVLPADPEVVPGSTSGHLPGERLLLQGKPAVCPAYRLLHPLLLLQTARKCFPYPTGAPPPSLPILSREQVPAVHSGIVLDVPESECSRHPEDRSASGKSAMPEHPAGLPPIHNGFC